MKPSATLWVIGSYHNIFRVGTILQDLGFWILNDVVWRKIQPDAEFPRPPLHQCARDADLGRARRRARAYTFNYEALKAGNDDVQMRSDWTFPLCTGEERLKGARRQEAASDAKAGSAAGPRHPCRRRGPTIWCSTRSAAPAPPARSPSASAAASSASSATPTTPTAAEQRIAAIEPCPSRRSPPS